MNDVKREIDHTRRWAAARITSHQAAVIKLLDATKPDSFISAQSDLNLLVALVCHIQPV